MHSVNINIISDYLIWSFLLKLTSLNFYARSSQSHTPHAAVCFHSSIAKLQWFIEMLVIYSFNLLSVI